MYTIFCREDVVADLVEQISELTAIIEQLRRDHQVTHKQVNLIGRGERVVVGGNYLVVFQKPITIKLGELKKAFLKQRY